MLRRLRIRGRLFLGFGLLLFFLVISNFLGLQGLSQSNDRLKNYQKYSASADNAINSCRINVNITARLVREMLINPDTTTYEQYKADIDSSVATLREGTAKLKKAYQGDVAKVDKYIADVEAWVKVGEEIEAKIMGGDDAAARDQLFADCVPALKLLVTDAGELADIVSKEATNSIAQNVRDTNFYSIFLIVCMVVGVGSGIVLTLLYTKSIVSPLMSLEKLADNIEHGILDTDVSDSAKDEIAQVTNSLGRSMGIIQGYVQDIDNAMDIMSKGDFNVKPAKPFIGDFKNIEQSITRFILKMCDALKEIDVASEQVSTGSEQVSSGAQELSQGATEQASSIEQLATTVNEISEKITGNAKNAQNAKGQSAHASREVETSNQLMRDMIDAMSKISNKSDEISKIIKTIEDIAFQTNILALNAAVEAARAGTAGKGFAVVADEVRNLASKSAEAAKTTTTLIGETVEAVSNGTTIVDTTAQSLSVVVKDTQEVGMLVDQIAEASHEQAEAIKQVTNGINQISSVIQTNSATAQESAATSEELSGQADVLKTMVGQFNLIQL